MRHNLIILASFLFFSCSEILETDISQSNIKQVSPGNNIQTGNNSILFYWDEIDGASSYKLQVATPSFDNIETFVFDTLISTNSFQTTLEPGKYGWRVKAINSYYETQFALSNFSIVKTNEE